MSRPQRPTPRTRGSLALCIGFVGAALLPAAGCSVQASWQTGSTAGNGRAREARPSNDDGAARERARRRRAQDEISRIDREAKERVTQAEREAAAKEREAEEEAERERQRAAADAEEQRKREAEAAAAAAKAKQPKQRGQATGRFEMGTEGGDSEADKVFQRRSTEIKQSEEDRKAEIRKRLEQNKSDILVAAERKRTEVQESLKEQPEKKP